MTAENLWNELEFPDLKRRANNMLRVGKISQVDFPNYRVKVKSGKLETNWLAWGTSLAGTDKCWVPCSIGEQVLIASPGGDLSRGIIICKIFSDVKPANGNTGTAFRYTFSDGTVIEYDKDAHKLKAIIGQSGTIEFEALGGVTIKGDVSIEGNVSITKSVDVGEDVTAQGEVTTLKAGAPINESTHIHPHPMGPTSAPVPGT